MTWWINTFFAAYKGEQILGVMTPEYLYYEEVPQRIYRDLGPEVKFLVVLRNPVDRAYSHYLMSKRRGFEKLTFEEAIEQEASRIKMGEHERNHFSYISRGLYSEQIERYLQLYPEKQFLFLSFEQDICSNLARSLHKIQDFLGVQFEELDNSIKSNKATEAKSETVQQLIRSNHFFKRLLKAILPENLRKKLKQKAIHLNENRNLQPTKLSSVERTRIFNTYFSSEINTLKRLTGYNFSYWNES